MSPRATTCVFLGNAQSGYLCYDVKLRLKIGAELAVKARLLDSERAARRKAESSAFNSQSFHRPARTERDVYVIQRKERPEEDNNVMACGEGMSLVEASRVLVLDVHLNPSVTRQAIGHAFRPCQERKVYTYKLVVVDSPEEEDHLICFRKEFKHISSDYEIKPSIAIDRPKVLISGSFDELFTLVRFPHCDNQFTDTVGILKIAEDGNLVLINQSKTVVWSTNASKAENPVAQLLDSGNLVIKDDSQETYFWQSFDYQTNTLLLERKWLSYNLRLVKDCGRSSKETVRKFESEFKVRVWIMEWTWRRRAGRESRHA
ncbi:hypothetical protein NE237_022350 [Protea cynaroides]|uniref:Bulb-type lectin domain-containing protein n=1 Tax=Protea cynaroides TaxID=273540 RepID=A0A9Q0HBX1_9MAGN|nr:hypothetical protein NE237_022350 [Protea cynaroides]